YADPGLCRLQGRPGRVRDWRRYGARTDDDAAADVDRFPAADQCRKPGCRGLCAAAHEPGALAGAQVGDRAQCRSDAAARGLTHYGLLRLVMRAPPAHATTERMIRSDASVERLHFSQPDRSERDRAVVEAERQRDATLALDVRRTSEERQAGQETGLQPASCGTARQL